MEVSPVPSPFPGTSSGAVGFEDHFLYPDGPLIGNGGWIANEFGDVSLDVVSHQVRGVLNDERGAAHPNSFDGLTWNSDWYIEAGIIFGTIGLAQSQVQFWWGDITVNSIAAYVNASTSIGSGHNVQLQIIDTDGSTATADITLASPTTEHIFVLRRQAGSYIISVDGVDKLTKVATGATPPANDNLVLFNFNDPVVPLALLTYVETGL